MPHLLADAGQIGTSPRQDLSRYPVTLANQTKKQVLSPDVVVTKPHRFRQRQVQCLLGPQCERDLDVGGELLSVPIYARLDLTPRVLQTNPQRLQRRGRYPVTRANQTKQQVLSPDVIVTKQSGLLLAKNNDPPRPFGEILKHLRIPSRRLNLLYSCAILRMCTGRRVLWRR
jgi:hypothetical protein